MTEPRPPRGMLRTLIALALIAPSPARGQSDSAPPDSSAPDSGAPPRTAILPAAGEAPSAPRWPRKDVVLRLSIEDAVEIALERNLDVRISHVDHWMATSGVTVERAAFDPFFGLGANYAKNRRPTASFLDIGGGALAPTVQANPTEFTELYASLRGLTPIGTTYSLRLAQTSFDRPAASGTLFGINPQISSSARLELRQPLLKGAWYPYNTANLRIARNERERSLHEFQRMALDTVYLVEEAYWQLAFSLKDYESRAKSLEVAQQDVENARKRRDVGTLAPIDVAIVESTAALRKVEHSQSLLGLENARDALLDLLNFSGERTLRQRWERGERASPYDEILVVPTTPVNTDYVVPERGSALDIAFDRRPDLHELALELRSQQVRIEVAESDTLPQVDLTGSWEQHGLADAFGDSAESLADGNFYSWGVGVALEVPLPLRGPRERLRQARDALTQIHLRRAKLENLIVLEIDQALREIASLDERVRDLDERVALQERILDAERKKVQFGKSISYTVSTIENDLIDSQARALRAKADYETARARLERSMGTLLDRHHVRLED